MATRASKIQKVLDDIQDNLYEMANKSLKDSIVSVDNLSDLKKAIKNKKIVKTFWCGNINCEDNIKAESNGAKSLNMPFNQPKKFGKCVYCRKDGKHMIYFGKSY